MKKKILFSLVIIIGVFALVGCGTNMVGKYSIYEVSEGKTTFKADQLKTLGVDYKLEVKADKTAVMKLDGEKYTMKYNDKYFTTKNDKTKYTFKDGKIIFSKDNTKMIFKKEN